MSKMYFIIWGYLNGLIRVENSDTLLKTHTNSCEGSLREPVAIFPSVIASLPKGGVAISKSFVIASPP